MSTLQFGTIRNGLGWATLLFGPLLGLLAFTYGLLPNPAVGSPIPHLWIVTLTALAMGGLAALMVAAAAQVGEARVFFLALTFVSIAGVFLNHALTTPFALVPHLNPWVGFSASLSLFLGAAFLALTTVEWPAWAQRRIVARQRGLLRAFLALIAAYNALAVATSFVPPAPPAAPPLAGGPFVALAQPQLAQLLGWVTLALLCWVIARYLRLYRTSRTPLIAGLLGGSILLAQAQLVSMATTLWRVSWWQYHFLILGAFCAAAIGLVRQYARSGSARETMEGLFLRDTIAQIERGYADVIIALVSAIEARDPNTRGHSQRVAELAVLIGEELRLPPEHLRVVSQAAILHDIGKIAVPDAILNKPGRLTEAEYAIVKEHPVRGYEIVRGVRSLRRELGGVRHHHERLDGSGYPDGLAGEAIPLEARIIAVADVYDALTASRTYRDAWSPGQALASIDADAAVKLDARCVRALHRALARQGVPLHAPPAPIRRRPSLIAGEVSLLPLDDALLPGQYSAAD